MNSRCPDVEPWKNPRLVSLLPEYRKSEDVEPCWMQGGHPSVPQPWVMPVYGQSAELEVCDLLYCLVRYLRPTVVVELGCHLGIGTYALGRGCQDAGKGHVYACDIDPKFQSMTGKRCDGLPVHTLLADSRKSDYMNALTRQADLLWLDCDYPGRLGALQMMKPGAVAVIHDTGQEPELLLKPLTEECERLGLERVSFGQTHRGLSIVQRVTC